MKYHKQANNAVFWYLDDLGSRVVANTGIPSDRHHVGKLILQSLKDAPDFITQIDGGTGETDTFQDALERSVGCANAFRAIGLKADDVIVVMAPNFTNLTISIYAAFYLGVIVAGVDSTLGIMELEETFQLRSPKLIFCQSEREQDVTVALRNINMDVRIVTYNKSENNSSFVEFIEKYGSSTTVDEFKPSELDPEKQLCLLVSTSGTTGSPKCAAITHKNVMFGVPYIWVHTSTFPMPIESALVVSPVQWLSATFNFILSPMLRFTRIQTSLPLTTEHTYFLINKYKPSYMMLSPTLMTTLLNPVNRGKCDFACFKYIMLAGSAVSQTLLVDLKSFVTNAEVYIGYGLSEVTSFALNPVSVVPGSVGRPSTHFHYRLVDPVTQEDIWEPNVIGELWLKGPSSFKGYYRNPKATAEIYTEDGWIKSGDLLYRDENWNFFYVERLKMLLKYRNHHISPTEVESVIIKHPGVLDVAVTGIPDDECGDLAVACVMPQHNTTITAQEIKDLVKDSLADTKQLRGGVIFMKQLPLTSTSKVNRGMLKKIVKDMKRE